MGQCKSKNSTIFSIKLEPELFLPSEQRIKQYGNHGTITTTKISLDGETPKANFVTSEQRHIKRTTNLSSDSSHQSAEISTFPSKAQKQTKITDKYIVLPKICGYGVAGNVRKCIHRETLRTHAVKTIDKSKAKRLDRIQREVAFLSQVDHPSIIHTCEIFEDKKNVHIVTEMCYGGELFDKIVDNAEKGRQCLSEDETVTIIHSLLEAVSYLHKNDICHRDIKPENILFEKKGDVASIRLIDFGLSIRHRSGQKPLSSMVGTSYYMAPQVLEGSYDKSCDIWSIGVMTYVMLTGRPPFNGPNDDAIFNKIKAAELDFNSPVWDEISEAAKDFIRCLVKTDPLARWNAEMALQHSWLRDSLSRENVIVSVPL